MKQPKLRFDRCHLLQMGDWALRFEVVFFTTVPDYAVYADAQQTINIQILESLRQLGVDIALPYSPAYQPGPKSPQSPGG
jgi:MscS family membrane protein